MVYPVPIHLDPHHSPIIGSPFAPCHHPFSYRSLESDRTTGIRTVSACNSNTFYSVSLHLSGLTSFSAYELTRSRLQQPPNYIYIYEMSIRKGLTGNRRIDAEFDCRLPIADCRLTKESPKSDQNVVSTRRPLRLFDSIL